MKVVMQKIQTEEILNPLTVTNLFTERHGLTVFGEIQIGISLL